MNEDNKLKYPLNGFEMMQLNPDAKLIKYDELNKVFDIDDLFKKTNKLIILYLLQSKTSGHWVCLIKKDDHFCFFDSYGVPEDKQLDYLSFRQRAEFNEKQKRLKILLHDHLVIYNNVCLQAHGTDTCGMFVTHRLHNSDLDDVEYIGIFTKNRVDYPDIYVADYVLNLFNLLKI